MNKNLISPRTSYTRSIRFDSIEINSNTIPDILEYLEQPRNGKKRKSLEGKTEVAKISANRGEKVVSGRGGRGGKAPLSITKRNAGSAQPSQSHRARIRAGQAKNIRCKLEILAESPASIDYAIVVPGHPLSHPRYRGPTCDQTHQIFVVSEGQLLFCE